MEAVPVAGCGAGCRVTALARGVDGALWIGTHNYGVRRLGGTGPAALTHVDGLPDDRVEALARADARDLAFVAHGLKGSSAQLGLARVAALSFEVERGAGTDLSLVPPLLSALESELACVAPLLAERQEREGLRWEITPLAGGGESGPPTPRR